MINFRGIQNSGSGSAAPPSATDLRGPRVIVGNAPNGDLATDCDFLDTGNGAQVAAALAAAGAFPFGADVWVRDGTYDLGAVGGPIVPLAIPASCTLRGASPEAIFRTRTSGDVRAFTLASHSRLERVTVSVAAPAAVVPPPPVVGAFIQCDSDIHQIYDIGYEFDAMTVNEFDVMMSTAQAFIGVLTLAQVTSISRVFPRNFFPSAAPSGLILGSIGVANRFAMIATAATGLSASTVSVTDCNLIGGDYGIDSDTHTHASNNGIVPYEIGVDLGATSNASGITNNEIHVLAGDTPGFGASCRGVRLNGTRRTRICKNLISAATILDPIVGSIGVEVTNTGGTGEDNIVGANNFAEWDSGVIISVLNVTNVVTKNRFVGTPLANRVIDNDGSSLVANNL